MTLVNLAPAHSRRRQYRTPGRRTSNPIVNICENDNAFLIQLAIPGIPKDQVKVDVKENQLIIDFEGTDTPSDESIKYLRKEYDYSGFKKEFNLSKEIDQSKIEAALENGVLTVTLEKKEEAKAIPPTTITIK